MGRPLTKSPFLFSNDTDHPDASLAKRTMIVSEIVRRAPVIANLLQMMHFFCIGSRSSSLACVFQRNGLSRGKKKLFKNAHWARLDYVQLPVSIPKDFHLYVLSCSHLVLPEAHILTSPSQPLPPCHRNRCVIFDILVETFAQRGE